MTEDKAVPFYRKKYYGAKAQKMWQIGFGIGAFVTFVLAPAWFDYWMEYTKDKNHYSSSPLNHRTDLQKMVYEKRLEHRRILQELNEKEIIENAKK